MRLEAGRKKSAIQTDQYCLLFSSDPPGALISTANHIYNVKQTVINWFSVDI